MEQFGRKELTLANLFCSPLHREQLGDRNSAIVYFSKNKCITAGECLFCICDRTTVGIQNKNFNEYFIPLLD